MSGLTLQAGDDAQQRRLAAPEGATMQTKSFRPAFRPIRLKACFPRLSEKADLLQVLQPLGGQDETKLACVRSLGAKHVAAMGNGRNDRLMLCEAALGVAVIGEEGALTEAVLAADVVCPGILAASISSFVRSVSWPL